MYIYVYSIHLSSSSLAQGPRFTTFGRNSDENYDILTNFKRQIRHFDENSTNIERKHDGHFTKNERKFDRVH